MRHRLKTKTFNRDTKSRKALIRSLVRSLIETGSVTTTEAKAKEVKRISDKVISKAKVDTVANRRLTHRFFGKRDVVNTLFERVAPEFKDRTSGFTTLSNAGLRRGDNSKMVKLSLVKMPKRVGTLKAEKKKVVSKTKKKVTVKKEKVSK